MRICLLSETRIEDDPRIRRHGDALLEAGFDVTAVGAFGSVAPGPEWRVRHVEPRARSARAQVAEARRAAPARLSASFGLRSYWKAPWPHAFLDEAVRTGADVFHANDWRMLPIAAEAARRVGGRYVYDSHEWGSGEGSHRLGWSLLMPPFVRAVESAYLGDAALVMTVSPGLASLFQSTYDLQAPLLVVRNVPAQCPIEPTPCRSPIRLLYHGIFTPDRGLEPLIHSTDMWQSGRSLTLRGFGPVAFMQRLERLAAERPLVTMAPPVATHELVQAANGFDVGVFVPPRGAAQLEYSLPNKVFEYLTAGLALLCSSVHDIADLVREHDLGVLVQEARPATIAEAVNRLQVEEVDQLKRRAHQAAFTLSWEREKLRLIGAYESLGS